MAELEVLRAVDYPTVPWKNGGGVTQEVARFLAATDDGTFDWRISIADVAADGPFSAFPGIDRILTLIEPAGVALTVDGIEHALAYLEPFSFSGDAVTTSRLLAGPTRDLNVMASRTTTEAAVTIIGPGPTAVVGREATTTFPIVVSGSAQIATEDQRVELGRLDAVRFEGAGTLSVDVAGPDGAVALIRLTI